MVKKKAVLEKLLDIIPGFHGYRKKEYIREDDRLIREYMVRVLTDAIRDLEEALSYLAEYDFSAAERFDNVLRDLRLVTDKIRWAEHGYAPHYNIVKIQEEDLNRIREVDAGLVDDVEKLREFMANLKNDAMLGNPVADRFRDALQLINSIKKGLMEREKIVRGWIEAGSGG